MADNSQEPRRAIIFDNRYKLHVQYLSLKLEAFKAISEGVVKIKDVYDPEYPFEIWRGDKRIVRSDVEADDPHERKRVFIVAHANGRRFGEQNFCNKQPGRAETFSASADLADAYNAELQRWDGKIVRECSGERLVGQGSTFMGNAKHDGLSAATLSGGITAASRNKQEGAYTSGEFTGTGGSGSDEDVANPESTKRDRKRPEPDRQQDRFADSSNIISNANDGRGAVWRHRELSATSTTSATRRDNGGGAPKHVAGQRGQVKPGLGRVVDEFSARLDRDMIFPSEPAIPRVAEGLKNRTERLKCLGNAVVPAQCAPILFAIAEIESPANKSQEVKRGNFSVLPRRSLSL